MVTLRVETRDKIARLLADSNVRTKKLDINEILDASADYYIDALAAAGALSDPPPSAVAESRAEYSSHTVPCYGTVSAGPGALITGKPEEYLQVPPWVASAGENLIALAVDGDSMQPAYYPGDMLLVRPQEQAENGEIVVVQMEDEQGEQRGFVKYLRREGGVMSLQSENPRYPDIPLNQGARIVGKVIRAVRYLDRQDLAPARVWVSASVQELPEPGSAGTAEGIFAEAEALGEREDPGIPDTEYTEKRQRGYVKPIRPEFPDDDTPHTPWLREPKKRP